MKRINEFMKGRNGMDGLYNILLTIGIIVIIIGGLLNQPSLNYLGVGILIVNYLRIFIKNRNIKQVKEKEFVNWYEVLRNQSIRYKNRIMQLKTHKVFRCPNCSKRLRVPKGQGRVIITCPNCHNKFNKTS